MTSSPQRYIYIDPDHLESPTSSPARGLFSWLRRKPTAPMLSPKMQALVQDGEIGTIAAPKRYFRGQLPMRWGALLTPGTTDPQLTYFGGSTDQAILT